MEQEHPWIKDAYNLSQSRHRRMKHPISQKPYFEHVINVYFQIYKFSKEIDLRVAALLHDGIKNKLISYNVIARRFNVEIADMVKDQAQKDKEDLSGTQIKLYYTEKFKRMTNESIMILLAERLEGLKLLQDAEYEKSALLLEDSFQLIEAVPKPLPTEHKLLLTKIIKVITEYNSSSESE